MKPSIDFLFGINPAFEALRAGRRDIHQVWMQAGSGNPRLKKLAAFCEKKNQSMREVSKHELFQRCQTREHQGVVVEASPYPYADPDDIWSHERILLIDNVEDPHNVGAILRSADAFGFHQVLLPTRGSPEVYPSVVKSSAGASEHLLICRSHSATRYVQMAQERDYAVLALDAAGKTSLSDVEVQGPYMLVVGGEDKGVGHYILNTATGVIAIPGQGRVNSLNASVAAAVAMHQLDSSCQ